MEDPALRLSNSRALTNRKPTTKNNRPRTQVQEVAAQDSQPSIDRADVEPTRVNQPSIEDLFDMEQTGTFLNLGTIVSQGDQRDEQSDSGPDRLDSGTVGADNMLVPEQNHGGSTAVPKDITSKSLTGLIQVEGDPDRDRDLETRHRLRTSEIGNTSGDDQSGKNAIPRG